MQSSVILVSVQTMNLKNQTGLAAELTAWAHFVGREAVRKTSFDLQ